MLQNFYQTFGTLDLTLLKAVQSIGPSWYEVAWLLSAVIGSMKFLAPAVILCLFFINKKRVALEVLILVCISISVALGLKLYFEIPRPSLIDDGLLFQYLVEKDYGMPSSHAFLSVIIFGWLWFKHPQSIWLSLGSTVLIILIGLSRVYLGVHYPSQVVAGWLFGSLFLFIFHAIDKRLWVPFQKKLN